MPLLPLLHSATFLPILGNPRISQHNHPWISTAAAHWVLQRSISNHGCHHTHNCKDLSKINSKWTKGGLSAVHGWREDTSAQTATHASPVQNRMFFLEAWTLYQLKGTRFCKMWNPEHPGPPGLCSAENVGPQNQTCQRQLNVQCCLSSEMMETHSPGASACSRTLKQGHHLLRKNGKPNLLKGLKSMISIYLFKPECYQSYEKTCFRTKPSKHFCCATEMPSFRNHIKPCQTMSNQAKQHQATSNYQTILNITKQTLHNITKPYFSPYEIPSAPGVSRCETDIPWSARRQGRREAATRSGQRVPCQQQQQEAGCPRGPRGPRMTRNTG